MTRWRPGDLARLKRRFNALPALSRQHINRAMEQGAEEIVAMQKRAAPEDDGDLIEAIHWRWRKATTALATIVIRAWSPKVKYAHLVEYGTRPHKQGGRFKGSMHPGTAAQPFFWGPYRALKRRVMNRIRRALKRAVVLSKNV